MFDPLASRGSGGATLTLAPDARVPAARCARLATDSAGTAPLPGTVACRTTEVLSGGDMFDGGDVPDRIDVSAGGHALTVGDRRPGWVDVTTASTAELVEPASVAPWWSIGPQFIEQLERTAPGPELTDLLDGAPPAQMSDDELIEAAAAWHRLGAWVASREAQVVVELVDRMPGSIAASAALASIAARTASTRASVERTASLEYGSRRMPAVGAMLAVGRIDAAKANAFFETDARLGASLPDGAVEQVLHDAGRLTAPQVRERLRRAVLADDPAAAEQAHRCARLERRVECLPVEDGMAWVSAFLTADGAATVMTALDALAGACRTPGDPRSRDERRADALTDVLRDLLDRGVGPDGGIGTRQHRRPHVQVTVAATTLLGLDDEPGVVAGIGPVPASVARRLAADGTWQQVLVDPRTGRALRVDGRRLPAGPVFAPDASCSVWPAADLIDPAGARPPGPSGPRPAAGPSPDDPAGAARPGPDDPAGAARPGPDDPAGAAGMGPDDPAGAAGMGPEPRRTEWDRSGPTPLKPVLGQWLPPLADCYRPPRLLTELVITRDVTCRFPGCRVPSWRCDLDHIEPFDARRPAVEQTTAENLHPLCRHHHVLKTHGGWAVRRDPTTGATSWKDPFGHEYTVEPDALARPEPSSAGSAVDELRGDSTPGESAEPPF